ERQRLVLVAPSEERQRLPDLLRLLVPLDPLPDPRAEPPFRALRLLVDAAPQVVQARAHDLFLFRREPVPRESAPHTLDIQRRRATEAPVRGHEPRPLRGV